MSGSSYTSEASKTALRADEAAVAGDSTIQMQGTFAENKDGVVTCKGQAAAMMTKCQPKSATAQTANRFQPLAKGNHGQYGPRVTSPGGAASVAAPGKAVYKNEISATHFNIPPVPTSFGPVSSYNASAVPTPSLGPVKPEQKDTKSSVSQWQERRDWGLGDLTVQCNKGKCQVNMGDIPVLLIEPNCTDTDGMKCTVTAPGGLSKKKRTDFLKEAVDKFESQMTKQTVSQEWNHSNEDTERFVAAMKEARNQVAKEDQAKRSR